MKILINIIISMFFLAFAATSAMVLEIGLYADDPVSRDPAEKTVVISAGQNFSAVAKSLSGEGLVKNPLKFKLLARIKGCDKRIRAGEYMLSTGMSPMGMLDKLVRGDVVLHRLTIPEGYNLTQIADAVQLSGWGDKTAFLSTARDESFVRSMGFDAKTFEGYLFPETYYFPKNTGIRTIISTMAERFKSVFTPQWKKMAGDMGFTVHQIVTIASIIEKETGVETERPLISSVFHNRLKKGMRLESDPSVIYGIEDYNGNITRQHLNTHTPYNTYMIPGLPPGPIANPGIKSIEAALFPANTDFLFFVAKKDTTHQFSTNINDHNRAVGKYQLGKSEQ